MTGMRGFAVAAALFGAVAVVMGAFGAHALRSQLDSRSLQIWHTAVEYQFWHALALLAAAGFAPKPATRLWQVCGYCFTFGIVAFCGSLYALTLGLPRWLGLVTPIGGLALILGWFVLACAVVTGYGKD